MIPNKYPFKGLLTPMPAELFDYWAEGWVSAYPNSPNYSTYHKEVEKKQRDEILL